MTTAEGQKKINSADKRKEVMDTEVSFRTDLLLNTNYKLTNVKMRLVI